MKPIKWIEKFLHFTHRERNGLIVFVLLIIAIDTISRYRKQSTPVPASFYQKVSQIDSVSRAESIADSLRLDSMRNREVKPFDPNSFSIVQLEQSGVPSELASNIYRYRKAGGEYRTESDLRKIYGMNDSLWSVLSPYVIWHENPREKNYHNDDRNESKILDFKPFDPNEVTEDTLVAWGLDEEIAGRWVAFREGGKVYRNENDLGDIYGLSPEMLQQITPFAQWNRVDIVSNEKNENTEFSIEKVEINTADSASLVSIPGIGGYTAAKIIETRTALGGFHSIAQLTEIYGIRPENFEKMSEYLTVDPFRVEKINVNQATVERLVQHPYISYDLADEIVEFREKFRPFETVKELQKLYLMDDQLFGKLAPYIKIE